MAVPVVLKAFDRALGREAHNLARWPELTWQQLHNRLQWEGRVVVQWVVRRREQARISPRRPSFRTRILFRESEAMVRVLVGHGGDVNACAFSPDGRRIVSGSDDRSLKVWDVESGACLETLRGHDGSVKACAFHPGGTRIVSASSDRTLRVWDVAAGGGVRTLAGHTDRVNACTFSPDGSRIVSGSDDRTVKVWDAGSGDCVRTLEGHIGGLNACAFSPDARWLVSGDWRGVLRVWDCTTWQEIQTMEDRDGWWSVDHCAVSPSGIQAISASNQTFEGDEWRGVDDLLVGTIKLWDPDSGRETRILEGHRKHVKACCFTPDGSHVVSGSDDRTVKVWDAGSGDCVRTLEGHTGGVNACAVSPDGRLIVSGSWDDTLRLWELAGESESPLLADDHMRFVTHCAFSPNGRLFASAGDCLEVWDAEATVRLRTLWWGGGNDFVYACAFDPEGKRLISAGENWTVTVWDAESGAEIHSLRHDAAVWGCAFSPDGDLIASASEDHSLKIWDAASGTATRIIEGDSALGECSFSPDGRLVAAVGRDGFLRAWDVRRGKERFRLPCEGRAWAFSPDGGRIASVADGVSMWDVRNRVRLPPMEGDPGRVTDCVFSPDGRWLVSTASDQTFTLHNVTLWDVDTGRVVTWLPLPLDTSTVAVHPWKPRASCGDKAGVIWPVDLEDVEYGPIIVTPIERDGNKALRCPKCRQSHFLDEAWLGQVIDCPTRRCDLRLRVNPFIVGSSRARLLKRVFGGSRS